MIQFVCYVLMYLAGFGGGYAVARGHANAKYRRHSTNLPKGTLEQLRKEVAQEMGLSKMSLEQLRLMQLRRVGETRKED